MTKGKELPKKIDGKNGNAVVKTLLGWVFNSTYEPCNKKIKRPLFRADSPMMLLTASSCAICGTSTNGLKFGISSSCVLTPAVISKRTESRGSLLAAWPWELGGRLSFWGRVVPTDIIVRLCKLCQLRRRNSITVHVVRVVVHNIHVIVPLYILHTGGAAGAKLQNARLANTNCKWLE